VQNRHTSQQRVPSAILSYSRVSALLICSRLNSVRGDSRREPPTSVCPLDPKERRTQWVRNWSFNLVADEGNSPFVARSIPRCVFYERPDKGAFTIERRRPQLEARSRPISGSGIRENDGFDNGRGLRTLRERERESETSSSLAAKRDRRLVSRDDKKKEKKKRKKKKKEKKRKTEKKEEKKDRARTARVPCLKKAESIV